MICNKHSCYGKHQNDRKQNKIFHFFVRHGYASGNHPYNHINNDRRNVCLSHQPLIYHKDTNQIQNECDCIYHHCHSKAFHYIIVGYRFLILDIGRYLIVYYICSICLIFLHIVLHYTKIIHYYYICNVLFFLLYQTGTICTIFG